MDDGRVIVKDLAWASNLYKPMTQEECDEICINPDGALTVTHNGVLGCTFRFVYNSRDMQNKASSVYIQ